MSQIEPAFQIEREDGTPYLPPGATYTLEGDRRFVGWWNNTQGRERRLHVRETEPAPKPAPLETARGQLNLSRSLVALAEGDRQKHLREEADRSIGRRLGRLIAPERFSELDFNLPNLLPYLRLARQERSRK